jgi:integrase/recombinase XerD
VRRTSERPSAGRPSTCSVSPRALKRLSKTKGTRQAQAKGLTERDVERVLATIGDSPIDCRDLAVLLIGLDLLARRSELLAIEIRDVKAGNDGSATVLIRNSKADQEGQDEVGYISPRAHAALHRRIEVAGITDGKVFRSGHPRWHCYMREPRGRLRCRRS